MNSNRILLVIDCMAVGGTQRQIVELLKGLQHNGRFAARLAVIDPGGELEAVAAQAAAGLVPLGRKARFDCTPALRLIWRARRAQTRLIHVFGWMSGLAGLLAARCLRIPIIDGTIRHVPLALGRRDRIARWCALHSDWIVANSRAGLEAYGLSGHPRAQVIANGIDLMRFDHVVPAAGDAPTVCMVANFRALKDHASVIAALPYIRAAVPGTQLVLVGKDLGTLAAHRRLADELRVSEAVRFVTDTVCPEPFIAGSQVCVLASPSESFSNAVLEYMALGKPVVATATCGENAHLISEGESGFLVPTKSPEAVAARVIELLRDPQRARRMGEAGQRQIRVLAAPRMVAEYEALYERLLASSSSPTPAGAQR